MPQNVATSFVRGFAGAVVRWQRVHGRHDLPWQATSDSYAIWLSEIMLQQTRAQAVIPFYKKFLRRWPDAASLARAKLDSVLSEWSGLGYYARARNLHAAAKLIRKHGEPQTARQWQSLPGVGKSTAAAVAVFAFGERATVSDGNVKRVLARVFAEHAEIDSPAGETVFRELATSLLPARRHIRAYTQGMMDLGATVCTPKNPKCGSCPLASGCAARKLQLTDQLPRRKPKKQKPLQTLAMAAVRRNGMVLLEKRPASGIWGGLWSLPEHKSRAALKRICETHLQCKLTQTGAAVIHHEFTHYRLQARVAILECATPPANAHFDSVAWKSLKTRSALPSPIKKFLKTLID